VGRKKKKIKQKETYNLGGGYYLGSTEIQKRRKDKHPVKEDRKEAFGDERTSLKKLLGEKLKNGNRVSGASTHSGM